MGEAAGVGGERLETLCESCVIGELAQPGWSVFIDPEHNLVLGYDCGVAKEACLCLCIDVIVEDIAEDLIFEIWTRVFVWYRIETTKHQDWV